MSRDDASDFRPRTGRIRDQGRTGARRSQSQSFVAQVMKAAAKANGGSLTQAQMSGGKLRVPCFFVTAIALWKAYHCRRAQLLPFPL